MTLLVRYWPHLLFALLLAGVAAGAIYAVKSRDAALAQAQTLRVELQTAKAANKALQDAQRAITDTLDQNQQETKIIRERTEHIKEVIREAPNSTNCANSPAIQSVLGELRGQ